MSVNDATIIKRKNRQAVLELLRQHGAAEVSRISQVTNIGKLTVHKIIGHYRNTGVVKSVGKADSGEAGKKPLLYNIDPAHRYFFTIQVFDTHIFTALSDLSNTILADDKVEHERNAPLDKVLKNARSTFDRVVASLKINLHKVGGIVWGGAGITDSEQGAILISPHFTSWGTFIPIKELIREYFPPVPVIHIDNWVRYQAYAEMRIGAARNLRRFLVIGSESDGITSGLVWDGVPVSGQRGLAGEIGHMPVNIDSNEKCICGGVGCLERAVSLVKMTNIALSKREERKESLIFKDCDSKAVSAMDIFQAADKGDAFARELLDEAAKYFSAAITCVVQVCDPQVIIIQGSYAEAGEFFLQSLRDRVRKVSLVGMDKNIRIIYSSLGSHQGLLGAAHFATDSYFSNLE